MKKYIMAIDQGTTSTRAILFDHDSNMVGIAQKEIENYYPHPGWVEQNANDVWACLKCWQKQVSRRKNLRLLG